MRIHGYEDDLYRSRSGSELIEGPGDIRKRNGTCVRAECIAEIDQTPFATENRLIDPVSGLIDEVESPPDVGRRLG